MVTKALLVVQLDPSDPVDRLGDWLSDAGLELDIRDLSASAQLPEDLSQHSGLLVLGGSMGANDDAAVPYLRDVKTLLRHAVSSEVPTLGVCLGGQLLAVANGGRVELNAEGPEVGVQLIAKRSAASDDPLFAALPITPDVIQWHYDAITALPPGAIQLASSVACDQQAFRLGRLAWGIQFHIETVPATIHDWAQDPELAEYDLTALIERTIAAHDDIAEVWRPFAARFADVVHDPGISSGVDVGPDFDSGAYLRPDRDPRGTGRGVDRLAGRAATDAEHAAAARWLIPSPQPNQPNQTIYTEVPYGLPGSPSMTVRLLRSCCRSRR